MELENEKTLMTFITGAIEGTINGNSEIYVDEDGIFKIKEVQ